jgi:hypothetical protein
MATDRRTDTRTAATTGECIETYGPDPIVIPVYDILDPVVGPLSLIVMGPTGEHEFAWSGVDCAGKVRPGTMRPRVSLDAANAITIDWEVEVDEG